MNDNENESDSLPISEVSTVSIKEVAEALGITLSVAYDAAATGRIEAVRVGRHWRVPVAKFRAMLEDPDFDPRPKPSRLRRFSQDEDRRLTDAYNDHVSVEEIATMLSRDVGTVRQRIRRLGLRRSSKVTRLLQWAPDHLRAKAHEMDQAEWIAACYQWREDEERALADAEGQEAERARAERLARIAEVDQRDDLSRNEKMRAKRMLGMRLEELAAEYGISRERVRQLTTPDFEPPPHGLTAYDRLARLEARQARERDRILEDAAIRLFQLWEKTPPEAREKFRSLIADNGAA